MTLIPVNPSELHYIYGRKWVASRKYMSRELPESTVREEYRNGEDLWVAAGIDPLAGDAGRKSDYNPPATWTINFTPGPIAFVNFFDIFGISPLRYVFSGEIDPDNYFLSQIDAYTFPGSRGQLVQQDWTSVERNYYDQFGYHKLTTETRTEDGLETLVEEFRNYDCSRHWEPKPAFGDWHGLTRLDRFT